MRRVAVAGLGAALLFGCGGHQPSPRPWLEERGRAAETWYVCARMGAFLRSTCDGAATCQERVTREVTRPCYAARYDAGADASPRGEIDPRALSPCFWDQAVPRPATPAAYAAAECGNMELPARLRRHCVAELRAVIEGICTEGAMDLTGAGP